MRAGRRQLLTATRDAARAGSWCIIVSLILSWSASGVRNNLLTGNDCAVASHDVDTPAAQRPDMIHVATNEGRFNDNGGTNTDDLRSIAIDRNRPPLYR